MRVFITGATGFIGFTVTQELLRAGHQVLGLTRSAHGEQQLLAAGAQAHHGNIDDLASIRSGAAQADAVIHTAFNHDFANFAANCAADRAVIGALADALAGSNAPLIITSGTAMAAIPDGQTATEDAPRLSSAVMPRAATEEAADDAAERGIRVSVIRLPQVHDTFKQGLIPYATANARAKGLAAYIGEGNNRWPAAHRIDTAHLYRLVLEKGRPGARYNAVAEEGVPMRDIMTVIGNGLNIPVQSIPPEQAAEHFGWLNMFAARDMPASSAITRAELGWNPTGPNLLTDLKNMDYSKL